jgi:hypothetical protein
MFDPNHFVLDTRYGYIVRHEGCDYMQRSYVPLSVRLNPLRLTVGMGRGRPCRVVINENAWMQRAFSNAVHRLRRAFSKTEKM